MGLVICNFGRDAEMDNIEEHSEAQRKLFRIRHKA